MVHEKISFFFNILFLFFCAVSSQTYLRGKVVDPLDSPIPNAEVYLKSTDKLHITGSDGEFSFRFNPSTTFKSQKRNITATFRLHPHGFVDVTTKQTRYVRMEIFDLRGRNIATIYKGMLNAGNHRLRFSKNIAKQVMLIKTQFGSTRRIERYIPGQNNKTFSLIDEPQASVEKRSAIDHVTVTHYDYDDITAPVADYDEIVTVRLTQKKLQTRLVNKMEIGDTLKNSSNQLRLVLDSIRDKRCCYECSCETPGFYEVYLTFIRNSVPISVQLHSTEQRETTHDGYRISLIAITPEYASAEYENYEIGLTCSPVDSAYIYDCLSLEFFEAAQEGTRKLRKHDDTYRIADFQTLADWEKRKEYLRRHILFSSGLWPETGFVPLEPTVLDAYEGDGYVIKKVYMPIWEGYYLTGNLYLPTIQKDKYPAMLCPHGHWTDGRLQNTGTVSVPRRCIHYAKQGYIVFSYDIPGNVDSKHVSHFFTRKGSWGSYSNPGDDIWGISSGRLLLAHSMRASDFLHSLENVDTTRVGVTGASGGATQTMYLGAVDGRVDAVAPVSHVSAHLQDGCGCGNAPLMRINTHNVEIAAMASDKPVCLVGSQGDWSCNTMTVEYPMIRNVYELYGKADLVQATMFDFDHNYNQTSREYVYDWFGSIFLNQTMEYRESAVTIPSKQVMSVWSDHPRPSDALNESGVRALFKQKSEEEFARLFQAEDAAIERHLDRYGQVWDHVISPPSAENGKLTSSTVDECSLPSLGSDIEKVVITNSMDSSTFEVIVFTPHFKAGSDGLLVVNGQNSEMLKIFFCNSNTIIRNALNRGTTVMLIDQLQFDHYDLFSDETRAFKTKQIVGEVDFFSSYNRTDEALCTQTISDALSYLNDRIGSEKSSLYCTGDAGVLGLLASTINDEISSAAFDLNHFDPENENDYLDKLYIPHIRRAGGIESALCVSHAEKILLYNTENGFPQKRVRSFITDKTDKKLVVESTFSRDVVSDFLLDNSKQYTSR